MLNPGVIAMIKYGLIYYNFKDMSLDEFLDYASERGFTHVELFISHVWDEKDDTEQVDQVQKAVESRGLKVGTLSARNDFVVLDPDEVDAQVRRMRRVCEIAERMGVSVLRTEGGQPKESVPQEKWVDAMAECLRRCREFIEPAGIHLAVDNHGVVTNDADLQVELIERVGSPYVGATLDTMNYRWMGHDLDTIRRYYKKIAPYVRYTHFKDGRGSRGEYKGLALGDGEIDLDYALQCLLEVGYSGVWGVEYEGPDPVNGYAQGLAWLKSRLEK